MLKRGRSATPATTNMIYFGTAIAEVQCQLLYKTKRIHIRLVWYPRTQQPLISNRAICVSWVDSQQTKPLLHLHLFVFVHVFLYSYDRYQDYEFA